MAVILKVLFAPSSFNILNNVIFQEFFKQFNGLIAGHFWAKVLIRAKQFM